MKTEDTKKDDDHVQLEQQQTDLEEYEREIGSQSQAKLIQKFLKNIGVIVLGAGIFFTATDNMIGPYMMGLGAAAAGFSIKDTTESVSSLLTTDRKDK